MSCGRGFSRAVKKDRCGWVKDKYGLSWQIVPSAVGKMLGSKDPEKSKRVMEAMMQMDKIDIRRLQEAHEGRSLRRKLRRRDIGFHRCVVNKHVERTLLSTSRSC